MFVEEVGWFLLVEHSWVERAIAEGVLAAEPVEALARWIVYRSQVYNLSAKLYGSPGVVGG